MQSLEERIKMAAAERDARGAGKAFGECPYRGAVVGMRECASCKGNVSLKEYDCRLLGKVTLNECAGCVYASDKPKPTIGVVMAACNEHAPDELPGTLQSIDESGDYPEQVIIVDDASDPPHEQATIRNVERLGCSVSRHIGCNGVTQEITLVIDPHMKFERGDILRVCRIAQLTNGLAYAGCRGGERDGVGGAYRSAKMIVTPDGLFDVVWGGKPSGQTMRTTGFMGAFYAIPTALLEDIGGWIGLPGYMGADECAMSILLAKHEIPITVVSDVHPWHKFRQAPGQNHNLPGIPYELPANRQTVRTVAMYRLLFEDATWAHWRKKLLALGVSPGLIREVEEPEMIAYGESIRARCVLNDVEFFLKGTQCT